MFFPMGDLPKAPGRAYANMTLVAINVAVFVLITVPLAAAHPDMYDPWLAEYLRRMGVYSPMSARIALQHISAYDVFVFHYGFKAAQPNLLSLFVSLFLHGGFMHLAGNMLFLWIFGQNVEHRLGPWRYLLVYFVTGVAATLFFAMFTRNSYAPLIGASGAISGILGCYFIWFPRNKIKTFVFLFPLLMTTFYLPARLVLGFYLVVDNLLPFLFSGGDSGGVAHGAHLGGFFAGMGLAWLTASLPGMQRGRQLRQQQPEFQFHYDNSSITVAQRLQQLLDAGNYPAAVSLYFSLKGRAQRLHVTAQQAIRLGEYLLEQGDYAAALSLFRRFIAERPNDPLLDRAFFGAGVALLNSANSLPSAHQYFLAVLDVTRDEQLAQQARHYLAMIDPRIAAAGLYR